MEDERFPGVEPYPVHPADHDVVVAAGMPDVQGALDVGDAAVQQRVAENAHPPVEAGELVRGRPGEALRDRFLVGRQHVDGEMPGADQPFQAGRPVVDAEEHERWLK